jgi:hypothetical protein
MVSVMESVTAIRPTGPINFGSSSEAKPLQRMRALGHWTKYGAGVLALGCLGADRGVREWCMVQRGGVTMFQFRTNGLEVAAARYNELSASCMRLVEGLNAEQIGYCVRHVEEAKQALVSFDEAVVTAVPRHTREAACRPRSGGATGRTVAGRLPIVFTKGWIRVIAAALSDIRQSVACQLAMDTTASNTAKLSLALGSLLSSGRLHTELVKLTLCDRDEDHCFALLTCARRSIAEEHRRREGEVPVDCMVTPILVEEQVEAVE